MSPCVSVCRIKYGLDNFAKTAKLEIVMSGIISTFKMGACRMGEQFAVVRISGVGRPNEMASNVLGSEALKDLAPSTVLDIYGHTESVLVRLEKIYKVATVEEFLMAPASFRDANFKEDIKFSTSKASARVTVATPSEPLSPGVYLVYYQDGDMEKSFFFKASAGTNLVSHAFFFSVAVFPHVSRPGFRSRRLHLGIPSLDNSGGPSDVTKRQPDMYKVNLPGSPALFLERQFAIARELFPTQFDAFMDTKQKYFDIFLTSYFDVMKPLVKTRLTFPSHTYNGVTAYPEFTPSSDNLCSLPSPLALQGTEHMFLSTRDVLEKDEASMKEWLRAFLADTPYLDDKDMALGIETTCQSHDTCALSFPTRYTVDMDNTYEVFYDHYQSKELPFDSYGFTKNCADSSRQEVIETFLAMAKQTSTEVIKEVLAEMNDRNKEKNKK